MPHVLAQTHRLFRLALGIRLIVLLVSMMAGLAFVSQWLAVLSLPAAVLSTVLLIVSVVIERRQQLGATRGLLIGSIVLLVVESSLTSLAFSAALEAPDGFLRQIFIDRLGISPPSGPFSAGITGPQFFIALAPAMLGAWLDGRQNLKLWIGVPILLGLAVVLADVGFLSDGTRFVAPLILAQIGVLGFVCYFAASLADTQRAQQAELERANQRLAEQAIVREQLAATRERNRLARDLHDTMAHSLAGLVVEMDAIATLAGDCEPALKVELARAKQAAKRGLEDTRSAIQNMRLTVIEDLGLTEALRQHVVTLNARGQSAVVIVSQGDIERFDRLSTDRADQLFRMTQEALTNAERHARAGQITLLLDASHGLRIAVTDDGVGFDVTQTGAERFGLRGLRERAELCGAQVLVTSRPGNGTTVQISIAGG
jgi:signal transduction histidine kinase